MSQAPVRPQAKRIGIFGGAFDPPHMGHVGLAKTALTQLQLDELRVIPTGQAWHKTRSLTSAEHRLAMTRLTFGDMPRVVVDTRELQRQGPSYTADTLAELGAEYPGAQLYLVVGEDQAHALPTWHRWEEVAQLAIICVAGRADFAGASGQFDALKERIPTLIHLKMPPVPLSATHVRQLVAGHENVAPLVFDSVARYIDRHHLYLSA